ncbi:hypothetical protein BN874_780018 [Candidatus Contendobacter odensis Run_B_J11]|uniref:Uncharacterized protein n=1 Tax=Candidatus Contendobacter odensis Run_B_J11 TaxID=1400861 RepID=A0A7U7J635_9GAMM|nr:hypothetical protein BN874_780018 [Candidatus Contendobacter odensis Run_B_J11]
MEALHLNSYIFALEFMVDCRKSTVSSDSYVLTNIDTIARINHYS